MVKGSYMDEEVQKRAQAYAGDRVYRSYQEIEEHDVQRNHFLNMTRHSSVAWSGMAGCQPRKMAYTCLPRLVRSPVLWSAVVTFAITATLTRTGVIPHERADYDESALANSELLVSLLMAFYLGYCYSRYYAIYFACMDCRNAVFDCCALAAVYLYEVPDVWKVWRYTNLAHVATMVGVSHAYTTSNLFTEYVAENGLFEAEDEREREKLLSLRMEYTGMMAPQACISWAMAVVSDARRGRRLEKPEGVTLGDKILGLRQALASLFHFQFQTIPYVYLHLISLMVSLYLITFAAFKGLRFHPDETLAFGLVFPCCTMLVVAVTCAGLIAVGSLLANPLGSDVTDFAVLSFLRSCSANSRQTIVEQLAWLDSHARARDRDRSTQNGPAPAEAFARQSQPATSACAASPSPARDRDERGGAGGAASPASGDEGTYRA